MTVAEFMDSLTAEDCAGIVRREDVEAGWFGASGEELARPFVRAIGEDSSGPALRRIAAQMRVISSPQIQDMFGGDPVMFRIPRSGLDDMLATIEDAAMLADAALRAKGSGDDTSDYAGDYTGDYASDYEDADGNR